jgi:hypothetical protein
MHLTSGVRRKSAAVVSLESERKKSDCSYTEFSLYVGYRDPKVGYSK